LLTFMWATWLPPWQNPFDQQLDLAAAGLLPEQARLDDLGVVEDQQVARLKELPGRSRKMRSGQLLAAAVEQPRAAAFHGGVLGDKFRGKGEIEIAEA
jgi:hypothetical protein